jgi:hypothetical protein
VAALGVRGSGLTPSHPYQFARNSEFERQTLYRLTERQGDHTLAVNADHPGGRPSAVGASSWDPLLAVEAGVPPKNGRDDSHAGPVQSRMLLNFSLVFSLTAVVLAIP